MTEEDYELCWLSGMRRVLCSSSEVYRVNRCVEIVLLLLWPNLSTAVRTFESASSPPKAIFELSSSVMLPGPADPFLKHRVFTWG